MSKDIDFLLERMTQCEDDTREIIDDVAAARLSHWRDHYARDGEEGLIKFIRQVIYNNYSAVNGKRIHEKNGISLESIVITHCKEYFSAKDIVQAEINLGLRQKQPRVYKFDED